MTSIPTRATPYITNWPLLFEAVEYIATHPDEYDQLTWRTINACDTTRCVAGWVAHLAGYQDIGTVGSMVLAREPDEFDAWVCHIADGTRMEVLDIGDAALNALGVNPPDRYDSPVFTELFNGDASWRRVLEVLAELAQHDGVEIPEAVAAEMARHHIRIPQTH